MSTQPQVELREARKIFRPGEPDEVRALDNLSLTIANGEFVVVVGTNGSGKSTLLNAVAGTLSLDSGQVRIAGRDVTSWPEHRRALHVARVFQNPFAGTAPSMTVLENFAVAALRGQVRGLGRAGSGSFREQVRTRITDLRLGLENRLDVPIGSLSGGQRQALSLLMAVWRRPDILLLDEHTAALDPRSADHVAQLSHQFITTLKLTALMVTHAPPQACQLGDRLLMFHRGRVVHDDRGADKRRLRPDDLLARFEDLRRADRLDDTAVALLQRSYS
jgi:putative ABC transport system ATP-binding protein